MGKRTIRFAIAVSALLIGLCGTGKGWPDSEPGKALTSAPAVVQAAAEARPAVKSAPSSAVPIKEAQLPASQQELWHHGITIWRSGSCYKGFPLQADNHPLPRMRGSAQSSASETEKGSVEQQRDTSVDLRGFQGASEIPGQRRRGIGQGAAFPAS